MLWGSKKNRRLIFVAHRRHDNPGYVGMIVDRLEEQLKPGHDVFIDVHDGGIIVGDDFQATLDMKLRQSAVVIALIGKRWLDLLKEKAESQKTDYLEYELSVALSLPSIKVFPIYIDDAVELSEEHLPSNLKRLVRLQHDRIGIPPRSDTRGDIDRLVGNIQKYLAKELTSQESDSTKTIRHRVSLFFRAFEDSLWRFSVTVAEWFLRRRGLLFSTRAFTNGFTGFPYDFVVVIIPFALCFCSYLSTGAHWIIKLGLVTGQIASLLVGLTASFLIPFAPIEIAIKYQQYEETIPDASFRSGRALISVFILLWIPFLYATIWYVNHTGGVRWMDATWNLIFG